MVSGGQESIVLSRLAEKAFSPVTLPFPSLEPQPNYTNFSDNIR
jgi:hypothetical protein